MKYKISLHNSSNILYIGITEVVKIIRLLIRKTDRNALIIYRVPVDE